MLFSQNVSTCTPHLEKYKPGGVSIIDVYKPTVTSQAIGPTFQQYSKYVCGFEYIPSFGLDDILWAVKLTISMILSKQLRRHTIMTTRYVVLLYSLLTVLRAVQWTCIYRAESSAVDMYLPC